jgi:hypothetical protein
MGANKRENMITNQETIEKMVIRHANAQNVFTGEPLTGKDLKDWKLLNRQREYSLVPIEGNVE